MCRCAFLTMDDLTGYVSDDELTIKHLHDVGWTVEMVSWRKDYNWSQFDVVVIRTTWDYQNDPDAFFPCSNLLIIRMLVWKTHCS